MTALHEAYRQGVTAAAARYKLAFPGPASMAAKASTTPTSPNLSASARQNLSPSITPQSLAATFTANESARTHVSPPAKVAEALCTTCRKQKHYGTCPRPPKTKPAGEPIKRADMAPPPTGWGDEGLRRIERAFDQFDRVHNSSVIEGTSQPDNGPAALA